MFNNLTINFKIFYWTILFNKVMEQILKGKAKEQVLKT